MPGRILHPAKCDTWPVESILRYALKVLQEILPPVQVHYKTQRPENPVLVCTDLSESRTAAGMCCSAVFNIFCIVSFDPEMDNKNACDKDFRICSAPVPDL